MNFGRSIHLGKFAGIPVHVSPTWFIVAAVITIGFEPFVSSQLPNLGMAAYAVTLVFALLLYGSVFLHEVSHAMAARAFGFPVRGITLHFLGGYTEIERDNPTPGKDLLVSAAGPALSLGLGGLAWLAALPVHSDVPEFLLFELAAANVIVGVFNLLPALPLDGGHMLRAAVWRLSGDENRGTIVAARAGQVLAALVILAPFVIFQGRLSIVSVVWAALVAGLLWSGASQALAVSRVRARLPSLSARQLARTAAPVAPDLPVSQAVIQAREAGVGALVVVDSAGRPTGIVNHAAVSALPEERQPWVPVSQVSRTLQGSARIRLDLSGDKLIEAMRESPASEYLVVDEDGAVFGVLATADVDAALSARQAK